MFLDGYTASGTVIDDNFVFKYDGLYYAIPLRSLAEQHFTAWCTVVEWIGHPNVETPEWVWTRWDAQYCPLRREWVRMEEYRAHVEAIRKSFRA